MQALPSLVLGLSLALARGPAPDVRVALTTASGETVTGTLQAKSWKLKTDFGSAEIELEQLASVVFGTKDEVVTRGGVELSGTLDWTSVKLQLDKGSRSFKKAELVALEVLTEGQSSSAAGFGGEWMTNWGPMKLERKGARFEGSYGWQDEGKVEGKLDGKRFELEWTNASGNRGTASLELWKDGLTFTGESKYPQGTEFLGGYHIQPARADPKAGAITEGQTKSHLNYHLRVPKDYDAEKRYTALALFHGSNYSSRDYVEGFPGNWPELAERYILVGFDGENLSPASREGVRAFNASYVNFSGDHVGEPWRYNQTPGLVSQAFRELQEFLPIERWYVGGHSQGGFLTFAVAMFYPEQVAGAFPVSCALLVQCEPSEFSDEKVRAAQRRIPFAIVHGEKDDVVEFSSGVHSLEAFQDGGFPMLRLFSDERAGHPWAFLPVDNALRWLDEMTGSDPEQLLRCAETALGEKRYRDATGALLRAKELDPSGRLGTTIGELFVRVDQAALPEASKLEKTLASNKDSSWVDPFWDFRARFAFAPAAAGVLKAYEKLRAEHEKPAADLFWKARGEEDAAKKKVMYREILERYYASSFYRMVRRWVQ